VRLLIHSRSFFPHLGGLEQAALVLARELASRGHRVTVATDVVQLGNGDRNLEFEVVRGPSFRELVGLARKCDVVHSNGHSIPGIAIAAAAGRPLVITHHGYQAECLDGLGFHDGQLCEFRLSRCVRLTASAQGTARAARQIVRHAVARSTLGLCAVHVAVSEFVARTIRAPRTVVVHNCADTSMFLPGPRVRAADRLLFVGRFVAEKGLPLLLQALALATEQGARLGLDLVGAGPLEPEMRDLAKALGLEHIVRFRGVLRGQALVQAIRDSAAVVVPSQWHEAFGIVAAEAIACGRVAIVSDRGGLSEVVEGLGTAIPADDPLAWARMMRRVVEDDEWRKATEKRALECAARFSPHRFVEGYLAAYHRALMGARMPGADVR
jgi:glycosyltransferase involved in cell wall biosynthesis